MQEKTELEKLQEEIDGRLSSAIQQDYFKIALKSKIKVEKVEGHAPLFFEQKPLFNGVE